MIPEPTSRRTPFWVRSTTIVDDRGGVGRVLRAGYSVRREWDRIPVLFLGRHLVETRVEYACRLQEVGETEDWAPWMEYLLGAAEKASLFRRQQVAAVTAHWESSLRRMNAPDPSEYNHQLLATLFGHLPMRFEIQEFHLGSGQRVLELKTTKEEFPLDRLVRGRSRASSNFRKQEVSSP